VTFEYDERKSRSNKRKHGIDFHQAEQLWEGRTLTLRSTKLGEERLLVIGMIGAEYFTAIITMRGADKETIRIISVRRSRNEEKKIPESQ